MSEEKLSVFPMGEKNDAYARYFVGQSYLKMLTTEGGKSVLPHLRKFPPESVQYHTVQHTVLTLPL